MEGSGGEQQQVYVTGADGEQMVLSGPEAAALLEQAGINIHDGTQVSLTHCDYVHFYPSSKAIGCQSVCVFVCLVTSPKRLILIS